MGGPLVKKISQHLPFLRRQVEQASRKVPEKTALGAMLTRLGSQSETALVGFLPDFGIRISYEVALSRITPGLLTVTSAACGTFGVRFRYFGLGVGLTSVFCRRSRNHSWSCLGLRTLAFWCCKGGMVDWHRGGRQRFVDMAGVTYIMAAPQGNRAWFCWSSNQV